MTAMSLPPPPPPPPPLPPPGPHASGSAGLDPKLVALCAAAEAGRVVPPLTLATAAQLIVGLPTSGNDLASDSADGVREAVQGLVQHQPRKAREDAYASLLAQAEPTWQTCCAIPDSDPPTTLTLFQATIWAWGEPSGLKVPVIRVPLSAVTAWWTGRGKEVKGHSSGGWFFGAAIPLEN